VAVLESLVSTPAIQNLIREGKTFQIPTQLQTGARYGMQTLDMSLRKLFQSELVQLKLNIGASGGDSTPPEEKRGTPTYRSGGLIKRSGKSFLTPVLPAD